MDDDVDIPSVIALPHREVRKRVFNLPEAAAQGGGTAPSPDPMAIPSPIMVIPIQAIAFDLRMGLI
jgi:hypothetical protein